MMKKFLTIIALGMAMTVSALNKLPIDPEVRIGKLDNGLTYYIRHNARPAGQADFFLAQSVGSINEDENQRGLAHFLEHMCFNGTENFPGNSLIDYLETIGVKFGANLNAYTSTDRTVYNICEVPTGRLSSLDSCLMILRDWSGRLLLNEKDIDEERGVIVGEWRQRSGQASARLLEKAAAEIYPGSRYGERMPIGLMSVVENFEPDELRDYYNKWYHPENQCVIVVGDIDVDYMERQIKRMWADAKGGPNAAKSSKQEIAHNKKVISTVQTDPEQGQTMLQIYVKHDGVASEDEGTIAELRREVAGSMVCDMLAERYDEIENEPASPFANLGIGDMHFLLASHQPALLLRANVKKGMEKAAVEVLATELKRAAASGFTPTEFERAKLTARGEADSRYASAATLTNTAYAKQYADHYLEGGILPSEEQRYKMIKGVISQMKIDDVNDYLASIVTPENDNVVILCYAPATASVTSAELAETYKAIDRRKLAAYVDQFVDRPLMATIPAAGKIVKEEMHPIFGTPVWTLSNGIKVNLNPNDYEADKVRIMAKSPGGISQSYDPALSPDYLALNDVLALSAVGKNSLTDLRKLLAGKKVSSHASVEKMEESLGASASVADLPTAFQLIYLRATDLRKDLNAFTAYLANQRLKADSRNGSPVHAMGDSIHANVFDHHPLGGEHLHHADLDRIDYDRILGIWGDRFGDMSDFTFYISGNFNVDSIRGLVETYVASLPANGRMEQPKDMKYHYDRTRDSRQWTMPMENQEAITYTFYNGPCDYNLENVITGHIFGSILQNRLREELREKRGWTYGVKCHIGISAGMNGNDGANAIMPVYIRVAPEHADSTFMVVAETVGALSQPGSITAAELAKVKEYMAKNYKENSRDNGYWLTVLRMYDRFGEDMHSRYMDILNGLTPDDVSAFGATYIADAPGILKLSLSPET